MKIRCQAAIQILLFLLLFGGMGALCMCESAEAASCSIQFTASQTEIPRGDIFTVVCRVTSNDPFTDVSFRIDYDDRIMQFIKGGKNVSGGYGELWVNSVENEEEVYKKTFSLQFMAKGKGSGMVLAGGTPEVWDASGEVFSVSANRLSLEVTKAGTKGKENDIPDEIKKDEEPEETAGDLFVTGAPEDSPKPEETLVNPSVPDDVKTSPPPAEKPSNAETESAETESTEGSFLEEDISRYVSIGIVVLFLAILVVVFAVLRKKR